MTDNRLEQIEKTLSDQNAITKKAAEVLHRCLVVFDDWLCNEYGFSRKPRGKHIAIDNH